MAAAPRATASARRSHGPACPATVRRVRSVAAIVTASAAMLNTVRCHGLRARKVLNVVWLQAATTAISVALGPSRITSEAKFAAKASDIVSGCAFSDAGIGTDTLKIEVRTARTTSATNVVGRAICRLARADPARH